MTDEERQKLCKRLRSTWSTTGEQAEAADEIERLALNEHRFEGLAGMLRQEIERLAAENKEVTRICRIMETTQ